jgi:hypothetical protein
LVNLFWWHDILLSFEIKMFLDGNIMPLFANFSRRIVPYPTDLSALEVKEKRDWSLYALWVSRERALADLDSLDQPVKERQPEKEQDMERLLEHYPGAKPPGTGEKASLAYRLRLLLLDRWNLWKRLTRYRRWQGSKGEQIDGTNNAAERAIGWWTKERYRTKRGKKRETPAMKVSRFAGVEWQPSG